MADAALYKNTPDIYRRYITHTTQKQAMVQKIQQTLTQRFDFTSISEFTFVDVGAGEGLVTIPIIRFLESRTIVRSYVIEPTSMIENITQQCIDRLTLLQKKIEEVVIPSADFILCSHVVPYLQDPQKIVKSMYSALKEGGMCLVVVTNESSDDVQLKNELLGFSDAGTSTKIITGFLKYSQVQYTVGTVESLIDVNGCFDGTDDGKAIFSFIFKKSMSSLSAENLDGYLKELKKRTNSSGELTKREDYIWIYK